MDWQVSGEDFDPTHFAGFDIVEVLIEFDGPRLFHAATSLCPMLFMLVDEDAQHLRHLVVPINDAMINNLKRGLLTVRKALEQPLLWVVDTGLDHAPKAAWSAKMAELPEEVLPKPGVMLWPHLQPTFTLRAIGEGLAEGAVPASVIRQVVDGATTALRKAALYLAETPTRQGRVKQSLRRLYDLPAQRFSYSSFEIAFGQPEESAGMTPSLLQEDEDELAPIGQALEQTINTALTGNSLETLDIALLEALEKLVPPLSGVVTEFEIGGRIISATGKTYQINRTVSQQVKKVLQEVRGREEKISTLKGMVSEMDRDNLTFTLRQTCDGKDHVCTFPSDFFDEVLQAFSQALPVIVGGRETIKNGNIEVSLFNLDEPEKPANARSFVDQDDH